MIAALLLALSACTLSSLPPPTSAVAPRSERFEEGVALYRAGTYEAAAEAWRETLALDLAPTDRGRVLKNLGNAAWRSDRPVEAAAWYEAALEHLPRDGDLWHDLELARREADLPPMDRGDWRSALWRAAHLLTAGESARFSLLCTAVLAVLLCFEAVRGGRLPKLLALVALALSLLCATPLVVRTFSPRGYDLVAVEANGAPLRSEPRGDLSLIGRLEPGVRVRALDRLLGWIRVESAGGEGGWVPEESVVSLAGGVAADS